MKELEGYRVAANAHNICKKYSTEWDECKSRKQVIDLAQNSACADFVCQSIAEGWGLQPSIIEDKYRKFINDEYISQQDGYTSKMYVGYKQVMKADTTQTIVITCNGVIEIPHNHVCEILVVDSDITLSGDGVCYVRTFGKCNIVKGKEVRAHGI